jgi:hypothetical protein
MSLHFWTIIIIIKCTRAVCKVCVLNLLLRVGTLWRCGDGLFFEVPPLASDALLTTLHPLLENALQTVDHFEISCLRAPFSWLEKPRKGMERDLNWILCSAWKKWIDGNLLERPPYSPDIRDQFHINTKRADTIFVLHVQIFSVFECRYRV